MDSKLRTTTERNVRHEKTWSASALTRTLVHTEQEDTDVTPGEEFVVEWGIGRQIPVFKDLVIRPGISGCAYWQIDDDSDDALGTLASERKKTMPLARKSTSFFPRPVCCRSTSGSCGNLRRKTALKAPSSSLR